MTTWTVKDIAKHLKLDEKYTRDKKVHVPGFPKPEVARTRSKQWNAEAVKAWAKGDKQ